MNDLSNMSEQDLRAEIQRREEQRQREESARRQHELQIYNSPENVAARAAVTREHQYRETLDKAISENSGVFINTTGIWEIYGEDPNCDFGGHHSEPFMGKFAGTLEAVVRHAILQPNFYTWGGGGRIKFSEPEVITRL